jgi:hypothetical protein
MDKDSQALFDELMRKQPHELRQSDIEFLRARQTYLNEEQRDLFGEAIGLETPKVERKKAAKAE